MNCKRSLRKGDRGPNCTDFRQLDAAVAEAKLAEQIILAVGIDQSVAGAKHAYFVHHFIRQMISLPRQAWDKHRENSKRDTFSPGEGRDRHNITLPGQQMKLVEEVLALGKPTVMASTPFNIGINQCLIRFKLDDGCPILSAY